MLRNRAIPVRQFRRMTFGVLLAVIAGAGVAGLFAPPLRASNGCCGVFDCEVVIEVMCSGPYDCPAPLPPYKAECCFGEPWKCV